jgi:hypothetical protein
MRVLVVHGDLLSRLYEAGEVWQTIAGLLRGANGPISVDVTQGGPVWQAVLENGRASAGPKRPPEERRRDAYDVVIIFGLIPVWPHLRWALRARLHRTPVLFAPLCMLTRDFASASWFKRRPRLVQASKPLQVVVLRRVWDRLATLWLVATEEERRQTGLAPQRCALLAWPFPDTDLAASVRTHGPIDDVLDPDGPIAFVSRMDVPRKGIDRLCAWLQAHAAELPRPALRLIAPAGDDVPPTLSVLEEEGLLEWDA